MQKNRADLLNEVAEYYSCKLEQHGETPRGVDWNSETSQLIRFEQLNKIIDTSNSFLINDFGCGYGAFYEFLSTKYESFSYYGIDVSKAMIQAAKRRYQGLNKARFIVSDWPEQIADYSIASGIFNVRFARSDKEWRSYLVANLDLLNRTSSSGFSFNCLTSYSDSDKMRDDLYYADPCSLFDLCKRRYSRNVALLHDYDLYEFTILVRK